VRFDLILTLDFWPEPTSLHSGALEDFEALSAASPARASAPPTPQPGGIPLPIGPNVVPGAQRDVPPPLPSRIDFEQFAETMKRMAENSEKLEVRAALEFLFLFPRPSSSTRRRRSFHLSFVVLLGIL